MNERGFIAIPAILKAVPVKVWGYLVAAVIVAVYTGVVYHQGGEGPRAKLASLTKSIKDAQTIHEAEDKRKEAESITAIATKDADYEKNLLVVSNAWKSYADSLRVKPGGSSAGQGPKPDQAITSLACNDPAKDALVSAAIEGARREVRAAITEYRIGLAGLFEQADKQAEQLITLQAEIVELARVNQ